MARESSQPLKERINITFKPAQGGAVEDVELPLKLLVVGDFVQRPDERKVEDRKPISIDKNSFDDVMEKQQLRLQLNVRNVLKDHQGAVELAVDLSVRGMKDFGPAHLVEQIPELKELMALREALVALKGPLGNTPAFRRAIEGVLADGQLRDRALIELGLDSSTAESA